MNSIMAGLAVANGAPFEITEPVICTGYDIQEPLARTLPFEKMGQYAAGTTFTEGLVWFRNKWFLYYGCADSMGGVAIARTQPI